MEKTQAIQPVSSEELPLPESEICAVPLKNRWLAFFLAWLFPGLGHFYQGRTVKGILFSVTILALLISGLQTSICRFKTEGIPPRFAATVYCDFGVGNTLSQKIFTGRLFFIPQSANASMAIPALLQASRVNSGKKPLWNGAFAPPARVHSQKGFAPSQNDLLLAMRGWFDVSTIYIAAAGLLNILVMFDAFAGPFWAVTKKDQE